MNKNRIHLAFVIMMLVFPAVVSLLRPGFFVTDDGDWMIIRFSAFYQELRAGQFPVRWLNRLNNGYGYPVATFLYPGFMYLATIPKVLGFGFEASVKSIFFLSVVVGTVFTYCWIRLKMSHPAALFGAALYTYHPYLLWDIYTRGSVGEVLALGIVPIGMWVISKRYFVLSVLCYGLLILSHNTLSIILLPVLFFYHGLKEFTGSKTFLRSIVRVGGGLGLGLGISSFFWIPALIELPLTVFSEVAVSNWREYFIGKLPGVGGVEGIASYGLLGIVQTTMALFASGALILGKLYRSKEIVIATALFFIGIVLSTPISAVLWDYIPLGKYVQFPFRFLSLSVITGSYVGASVFDQMIPTVKIKKALLLIGTFLLIGLSYTYFVPRVFVTREDSYYSTNQGTTTVSGEYMPDWVHTVLSENPEEAFTRISTDIIQINTIYWPGFSIYVNGQPRSPTYNNDQGLMRVHSDSDSEEISVVFKESNQRFFADTLSIMSFIVIVFLMLRTWIYGKSRYSHKAV